MWHQLSWSHYKLLITLSSIEAINYYSRVSVSKNLSVRDLQKRIKFDEYERLDEKSKEKLVVQEETKISDFVKEPILIKNTKIEENVSEKVYKN